MEPQWKSSPMFTVALKQLQIDRQGFPPSSWFMEPMQFSQLMSDLKHLGSCHTWRKHPMKHSRMQLIYPKKIIILHLPERKCISNHCATFIFEECGQEASKSAILSLS